MKKKGFTYVEVMIAVAIFSLLIVSVMKLNNTSETDLTNQLVSQQQLFEAQKQLEKYKTTLSAVPSSGTAQFEKIDGFYVSVQGSCVRSNLYTVTVLVRRTLKDSITEVKLQGYAIKN